MQYLQLNDDLSSQITMYSCRPGSRRSQTAPRPRGRGPVRTDIYIDADHSVDRRWLFRIEDY